MLAEYQITLPPQTLDNAGADAKPILEKALAQVGFIPNMYARMVHSPALLDAYLHGYAAFRRQSGFSTLEQEIMFLVISRENGCEYCVAAHSFIADKKSGVPPEVTDAIRDGRPIRDPKLQALARFTRIMVAARGLPSRADAEAFLAAGYEDRHILGVVLAISVKTISNYANHLLHTPLDGIFEARRWVEPA